MAITANIIVGLVAAIHLYFLALEMFLWRTPRVRAIFGTTEEFAESSAPLAANQGLYNGFLAAGLVLGLALSGSAAFALTAFILGCVVVAGLYGAATANPRILFVQALPGALALAAVVAAH